MLHVAARSAANPPCGHQAPRGPNLLALTSRSRHPARDVRAESDGDDEKRPPTAELYQETQMFKALLRGGVGESDRIRTE
eukprot:5123665-Alexandrium_andersonii.AAC.1